MSVALCGNPAPTNSILDPGVVCYRATDRSETRHSAFRCFPVVRVCRAHALKLFVESYRRYSAGNSRYNLDIQVERGVLIVARDRGTENPERFRARSDARGNFVWALNAAVKCCVSATEECATASQNSVVYDYFQYILSFELLKFLCVFDSATELFSNL